MTSDVRASSASLEVLPCPSPSPSPLFSCSSSALLFLSLPLPEAQSLKPEEFLETAVPDRRSACSARQLTPLALKLTPLTPPSHSARSLAHSPVRPTARPLVRLASLATMASLFGFGSTPVQIDIHLTSEETRRQVELKPSSSSTSTAANGGGGVSGGNGGSGGVVGEKKELCPVYYDAESVSGSVTVRVKDGKKLVHEGIRLELVGAIGKSISRFLCWCGLGEG